MLSELKPALLITIVFTVLTGLVYPLAVTGMAQAIFPHQSNGSLIEHNGKVIGSALIGQNFAQPRYIHPRPSAAGTSGYDAAGSSGSNLGPTNPALIERLTKDAAQFRKDNPEYQGPIPADAITTSGSGLDPDISPANALAQAARVATARGIPQNEVVALIGSLVRQRELGVLGEPRVNVLMLNLALDQSFPSK